MPRNIEYSDLRKIKNSLPDGSIHRIAKQLNLSVETVRNYFGGDNYTEGESSGIHMEPGPNGGVVTLDDTLILDIALAILKENNINYE